ncbi:MAG: UDP-N-acetylmuramoyl-L-alanine--D-glutamate ligase [Lachnospiraceae bacterium]|nr:UDP-N-acetylmuramoyl-L-alanine--D-glutamate ligase [Lachnospiraceae bacterium]
MELKNKKVLVYGSGKSGQGAAALLEKCGAEPFIYDDSMGDLPDLSTLDAAVLSPGVPTDKPQVLALKAAGIPVIGEVELAYITGRGRVLAITGTNGKTTTTSLVGAIMRAAQDSVFVVGNIGTPYTSVALDTREESAVVAEISSFQLETAETFHPVVSAILNITEDHLNRHHTMEEYIRVKETISKNQTKADTCVLNYEDEVLRAFGEVCPASVVYFSSARPLETGYYLENDRIRLARNGEVKDIVAVDDLQLIGIHNVENVMAGIAMTEAAGVPMDVIVEAVKAFTAVEHRIEYVGKKNGVVWYNDSKGTNPDAAIKGIEAMKWPTLLIGGGYDKGSDYGPWIRAFNGKVKYFVLEGATRFDIEKAALENGFPADRIIMKENMTEAMDFCAAHAEAGDAILLSPACASWGEFPNYEVRGQVFKDYFRAL